MCQKWKGKVVPRPTKSADLNKMQIYLLCDDVIEIKIIYQNNEHHATLLLLVVLRQPTVAK
jgi:hypothetical protein